MNTKHIRIDLFNPNTYDMAIKKIQALENSLDSKVDRFLKALADRGVEIAKANVTMYNAVFTTDLLNSIFAQKESKGVYAIISDSKHSAFVEFGTGQVGQAHSYPYPFPDGVDWEYNSGATIFEIHDGQYGWYYPALDGTWKFTQGLPSRPYMYETAIELEKVISEVAKEVFK